MKKKKPLWVKAMLIIIIIIVIWAISLSAFLAKGAKEKAAAPGNGVEFGLDAVSVQENSPLQGKRILFLGSSVTEGAASQKISFVDYLEKMEGIDAVKNAVSGTTLVDEWSVYSLAGGLRAGSYIKRLNAVDVNQELDAVVCQLSTNDASTNKSLGEISDSKNLEDFDTKTITGAMEYIICYCQSTWECPVIFYTGSYYESDAYAAMVQRLWELQDKWNIGVIDLYSNEDFNSIGEADYAIYMWDEIHPTKAGYLKWWTPYIREELWKLLDAK